MNYSITKQWMVCVVAVGLVLGVFGGVGVTLADPLVIGEPCEDLFNCLGDSTPSVDPGPDIDLVIHMDKTVFELGEMIEGVFEVTNNSLEAITVDTYQKYDARVKVKDDDENILMRWIGIENTAIILRTTTIEPGDTIIQTFSWDQYDALYSTYSPVEPGQYIVWGYTPFTTRDVETTITIVPEPTTGLLAMLALCGLMASRK